MIALEIIKEVALIIASILGSVYLGYQIKDKAMDIKLKEKQLKEKD